MDLITLSDGKLDSRGLDIPLALITEWNQHDLEVRCPYCRHKHRHGIEQPLILGQTQVCDRWSDYFTSLQWGKYRLCFPFEDAGAWAYAYEIDKPGRKFRTSGLKRLEEDKLNSSDDTVEVSAAAEDDEGIAGIQAGLSKLVVDDTTSNLTASGMDEENEEIWAKWSSGISKEVNSFDTEGRTRLMIAALLGRIPDVEALLAAGAETLLEDSEGRRAYSYTKSWSFIQSIREEFLGSTRVDENIANKHRSIIEVMLQRYEPRDEFRGSLRKSDSGGNTARSFFRNGMAQQKPTIAYYEKQEKIAVYHVPHHDKSIAILDRGRLLPRMAFLSGWGLPSDDKFAEHTLWRDRVLNLCGLIEYKLPNHERDQGLPGSYYASHAEKKAIAFFVDKHVIFSEQDLGDISPESLRPWAIAQFDSRELIPVQPLRPIRAKVFVNIPVCKDCESFIVHVSKTLRIKFQVERR